MTIYDIPGIEKTTLPNAITPRNITAGFQVSGIMPFDQAVFDETDFVPSFLTNREAPTANPRKTNRAPNRKRQATVLTSTPVKNRLQRKNCSKNDKTSFLPPQGRSHRIPCKFRRFRKKS